MSFMISVQNLLLSNINHKFPLHSIVTTDFNAWCSRWWQNGITNSTGQEIDFLTLSAGYKHFFKLGLTPCKAEQPLRGMALPE